MTISASVTGCRNKIYIYSENNEALVDVANAINGKDVAKIEGVNHGAIDVLSDGSFYFFQASGYTPERGLFCDMLTCKPSDYPDKAREIISNYLIEEFDDEKYRVPDGEDYIPVAYTIIDTPDGDEAEIQVYVNLKDNSIEKEIDGVLTVKEDLTFRELDDLSFSNLIDVDWSKVRRNEL